MPHLNELSKKLQGKVDFVGVDVLEAHYGDDPVTYPEKMVKDFLANDPLGKTLSYNICLDTPAKAFEKQWMPLAAQADYPTGGIPLTFVIDAQGRLAWIGHPYLDGEFERALQQMVAGTYDLNTFIASCEAKKVADQQTETLRRQKSARRAEDIAPILKPMTDAISARDYALAINEAHRLIEKDPTLDRDTLRSRLNAYRELLKTDGSKALELVQWEVNHTTDRTNATAQGRNLVEFAAIFAEAKDQSKDLYAFAIDLLENFNPMGTVLYGRFIHALAYAYANSGHRDKALAYAHAAAAAMRERKADPKMFDDLAKEFEEK
jgi:hypothetical protein